MTEHPIIFSSPMVQAILEDRKTQTRRICKRQIADCESVISVGVSTFTPHGNLSIRGKTSSGEVGEWFMKCPYGRLGDILWVRESLYQEGELGLKYLADGEPIDEAIIPVDHKPYRNYAHCTIPNIHMWRWAARIFLKIKSIKVERLQEITEEDALAEGIKELHFLTNVHVFEELWQKINGKRASWQTNPWVWVIEFSQVKNYNS